VTPALVGVEEYEIANQVGVSHHWWVIDGHLETFATPRRYVWPSELDLMARLAGLSLREREEDWDCRRFAGSPATVGAISLWARNRLKLHCGHVSMPPNLAASNSRMVQCRRATWNA